MFDRIIEEALTRARIDPQAFDKAIKKAGFKSRFDWFYRGAPATLVDAYNRRITESRR